MKVLNYAYLNVNDICFTEPRKTRVGSYLIETYTSFDNKRENVYIQTPKLKTVDGVVITENRGYIDLEFDSNSPDFYQFITELDSKCIETTHTNSSKWFKQTFPINLVDEFYKTNIRPSRNNKPPTIRIKIPMSKKEVKTEFYDCNKEQINYENIKEQDELICVIQILGMKFLKQQFILETQLIQCKLCKENSNKYLGCVINDEENDIDDDLIFPDEIQEMNFVDDSNELESNNANMENDDTIEDILSIINKTDILEIDNVYNENYENDIKEEFNDYKSQERRNDTDDEILFEDLYENQT